MATILSFDPSRVTGWCWWDHKTAHSAIKCGVLEIPDKYKHYAVAFELGLKVNALIREFGKPDLIVIEEMALAQVGRSNADAIIYAAGSAFAITTIAANWGIPIATIAARSWHTKFFGEKFQPPQKITPLKVPDAKGNTVKVENLWKVAVVTRCEDLGITLPTKKSIAHNAADACAVAICWPYAKIQLGRHQQAFMSLLQNRNEKSAA